jgi:hypothetical protein
MNCSYLCDWAITSIQCKEKETYRNSVDISKTKKTHRFMCSHHHRNGKNNTIHTWQKPKEEETSKHHPSLCFSIYMYTSQSYLTFINIIWSTYFQSYLTLLFFSILRILYRHVWTLIFLKKYFFSKTIILTKNNTKVMIKIFL